MRKQPRIAAALAAFLLSSGMIAADVMATAQPAAASTTSTTSTTSTRHRARRARRVRRPQAPVTAENLQRLRACESGDNYAANTGNGYYGAYQFSARTWRSLGYVGLPSQAVAALQDEAATRLQAQQGWSPWPSCARRLRLR